MNLAITEAHMIQSRNALKHVVPTFIACQESNHEQQQSEVVALQASHVLVIQAHD
jgi:hypothetical protein